MRDLPETHHDLFDKYGCIVCGMDDPTWPDARARHLDFHTSTVEGIREAENAHLRTFGPLPSGGWPEPTMTEDWDFGRDMR